MFHEEASFIKNWSLHNRRLFLLENLTINDVSLAPGMGVLESRSHAEIHPFIYSSPMDTVTGTDMVRTLSGLGHFPVVCRFTGAWRETLEWWLDEGQPENVWFAIGAGKKCGLLEFLDDYSEHIHLINISVDVAHGDSVFAHRATLEASQRNYVGRIMSGTVCTPEGALRAIQAGSTHIRVGVGPGSACTTRVMTGFGVPNLSAVYRINEAIEAHTLLHRCDFKIIADGGIRNPGDAVKYITAGADGVMLGRGLSRTYESDGWKENPMSHLPCFKRYRGQASASFQKDLLGKAPKCAEGAIGPIITPIESVKDVVHRYVGGMQSAISYAGVKSITEMNTKNVKFERITGSGWIEGTPHGTT